MSRRKGELTRAGIDREWPHQVALRAPLGERYPEMIAFCRERSAAPRHPGFWRDDADWICFAFGTPADAETFQARFGGEMMYSKPGGAPSPSWTARVW